ncbi:LuxR C-terminal-related transcriptional regulator [Acaricomes phytoseiuli]|uniref:LuxR C-terminal-related transcriptional regulator n=1 Tax=Acaricomes phytoseiuli TaxID=291968 RepID=UPI002221ADF8|nr:LuxR family transcriptional regulator [Acaricomes phytoseiuli]MCW1250045.1 LuxR C-terminal-related transcriptional regulator [Acaricomes phytoseiuli]
MVSEREREMHRVREVFGGSREAILVVSAAAGLGKTYLLEEAAASFPDAILVRANPAETEWRYSGISAVLAALGHTETFWPSAVQRRDSEDDFLVAQELLRRVVDFGLSPRLVVIDDADRMDLGSQAVLGFLARRLRGTGLNLLLSVEENLSCGPFQALPELALQMLTLRQSLAVAQDMAKPGTVPSVLQIISAISSGNPAYLREGLEALSEGERKGRDPLSYPAHFGHRAARETERFFQGLSEEAQEVMLLVSTAPVHLERALRDIRGEKQHALENLIHDRVLMRTGDSLRVQQAVFRCMLYLSLDTSKRQELHAALAEAHHNHGSLLEQWHASFLFGVGRNSGAMIRTATELVSRGDGLLGTAYVDRAIILARSERENVTETLCDLARAMVEMGELNHAEYYLRWALDFSVAEHDRVRIALERLRISFFSRFELNSREVSSLVRLSKDGSPELNMQLLCLLVFLHVESWEVDQAKRLLGKAASLLGDVGPVHAEIYSHARSLLSAIEGDPLPALEVFEKLMVENLSTFDVSILTRVGRMLTYAEYYDQARTVFETILRLSPEPAPLRLETTRAMQAQNEIRAGQFSRAMEIIESLHATPDVQQLHLVFTEYLRSWYWLAKNDLTAAEPHIDRVLRGSVGGRTPGNAIRIALLRGHAALARGDYEEALRYLNRVHGSRGARYNPLFLRYEADLIEALVALDRLNEGRKVLADLEDRVRRYPSNWGSVVVARCRAMLAEGQLSLELYRQAVRVARAVGTDYEYGRTLSNYGDRLRQLGYVTQGEKEQLKALALFEEIGASPWPTLDGRQVPVMDRRRMDPRQNQRSGQVRQIFRGNAGGAVLVDLPGGSGAEEVPGELVQESVDLEEIQLTEELTAAERQVVTQVLQGRRNKEIAELLGLSLRAIETRLTNVYKKTGAQSRTRLVAMLNEAVKNAG